MDVADLQTRRSSEETLKMSTPMRTSDSRCWRGQASASRAAFVGLTVFFALLVLAGQARASIEIESFTTASSDQTAGGHPDLSTSFDLVEAGADEVARNVTFEAPTGLFGNPYAITHCTSSDFALDQCPSGSQAGLITVYANYEGDQHHLIGTAPIFNVDRRAIRRRCSPSSSRR